MKKKTQTAVLVLMGVLLLAGCGKVAQNTSDNQSVEVNKQKQSQQQTKDIVIASAKVAIELGQKDGIKKSSIVNNIIDASTVNIEADVPEFMTFAVNSDISFAVNSLSKIEADGGITVNVIYNDLLASNLEKVKVVAYLQEGNGLAGQTDSTKIIPLEVQVVDYSDYQSLSTTNALLKSWDKPFTNVVNETLRIKLKGDFSNAFKQKYKGTIKLEFVRKEESIEVLDQQATNFGNYFRDATNWQSFTPAISGKLSKIGLLLHYNQVDTGASVLTIYKDEGTDGQVLYTSPPKNVTNAWSWGPTYFNIENVNIIANQKYTIKFEPNNRGVFWGVCWYDPYTRGISSYSTEVDFWFETYITH